MSKVVPFKELVILCGLPRSGTTWLGKILDSHPDTLYLHEPDSNKRISDIPLLPELDDFEAISDRIIDFSINIHEIRDPKVRASIPVFRKSHHTFLGYLYSKAMILSTKTLSRYISNIEVPVSALKYDTSRSHIVWKSIESLGRLGIIYRSIPGVRIIHVVRHPCGYIASVQRGERQGKFGDSMKTSEDYDLLKMLTNTRVAKNYGLNTRNLMSMTPEERLAWRWVIFNDKALLDLEGEARYSLISYEHFCGTPTKCAHDLFTFCDLSWDSQTDKFVEESTRAQKRGYYSITKDPNITANSWEMELDDRQISNVISVAMQSETWKRLEKFYND